MQFQIECILNFFPSSMDCPRGLTLLVLLCTYVCKMQQMYTYGCIFLQLPHLFWLYRRNKLFILKPSVRPCQTFSLCVYCPQHIYMNLGLRLLYEFGIKIPERGREGEGPFFIVYASYQFREYFAPLFQEEQGLL